MNRETILEFNLKESEQKDDGYMAANVRLVYTPSKKTPY
jgi:hypothetical protein